MKGSLVCVPIMVENAEAALAAASRARGEGADLVELRIDPIAEDAEPTTAASELGFLLDRCPAPAIVTCRSAAEGGAFAGPEGRRLGLLELACGHDRPPRYVDIEHAAYESDPEVRRRVDAAVAAQGVGLILSFHDFDGRPSDLVRTLADMRSCDGASVLKIAFRARSLRDNLEVFELLRERDRPMIAMAMGAHGGPSRILAPKFGGLLTFASLDGTSATAPGQPTVRELGGTYRFGSIGPGTRVYGVAGDPVEHSIGPAVHNAVFESMGVDARYLRLPIEGSWESFKATVLSWLDDAPLGFGGASVTLPHKEHLVRLAREDTTRPWTIEPAAERIGAANTLTVDDTGACAVANTDAEGIVGPLEEAAGGDASGMEVAVLGAGGAARAAAAGLAGAGARVRVLARNAERAGALAAELGVSAGGWDELAGPEVDAVVHCTPIGMEGGPNMGESPMDARTIEGLGASTIVFDTVYRPRDTPLIRLARDRGLRTIDGLAMFTRQAMGQIERWTGRAADPALVERACVDAFASS